MKKSILILVTLMLGTLSYAQNIQAIYTYESINGIKTEVANENVQTVSAQDTSVEFRTLADLISNENSKNESFKDSYAKNKVVVSKTKEEVLVRYNGKYSSIKLVDSKGRQILSNYSGTYKGLVLPRFNDGKKVFLKAKKKNGEVYYHRVTL